MIRKFAGAMLLAIGISGCNAPTAAVAVGDVQAAAQGVCGFLPVAITVTNVLTVAPVAATAETIANLICKAVEKPSPAVKTLLSPMSDGVYGSYKGVPIKGHWVS